MDTDSNIQKTSGPSSTITDSSITSSSSSSSSSSTNHVLEITLISAQDLAPVCKSLRTYALAWVNPNKKRTTKVDNQGHTNPTWNDKFSFRVDDEFLNSETSAVNVEIYTVSWFRDILVGTVKVLIDNLINPFDTSNEKRFVALQIRRPSGNPQGILNMGVALIDKTKRSGPMPLIRPSLDHRDILDKKINDINAQDQYLFNEEDIEKLQINNKIKLWQQTQSVGGYSEGEFPNQAGSICNAGSMVNGSELCSDIGPSASIVAAEIATKNKLTLIPPPQVQAQQPQPRPKQPVQDDGESSSILEELTAEEAYALSKKEGTPGKHQRGGRHARRNTDGVGLYSCFGNAYCFEFTIVCGASNGNNNQQGKSNSNGKSRRKWSTSTDTTSA